MRNVLVTALIVMVLVAVSAGAAFAAGQARGESAGVAKGRQEAIAQLQSQFQQARGGSSRGGSEQTPLAGGLRGLPSGGAGGFFGGGGASGVVESVSGNTIVISLQRSGGGTQTVTIGPETVVRKLATGALGDITPGANVTVSLGSDATGPASTVTILGIGAVGACREVS